MLRAYLFGGLVLRWNGAALPPIAGIAPRSLLAYLLTYRDRPHTRSLLAGTFWPDLPEDVARRRLSQALWRIRKALDPHPVLMIEGDTVQINAELPLWLDIEQFARDRRQCFAGDTGGASAPIGPCESCLEHYRGDFLAGYYEDWLFPERERLREQMLDVLERLVAIHKRQGDYAAALVHARRLASEDLLREEAHREVMRLCHLLGRDTEALVQFETCRRVLREELGAEPSPATVALVRRVAEHSDQAASADLPWASPPSAAPGPDAPLGQNVPLVGRGPEREEMLVHVDALLQGLGAVLLLEGEAGVGKTRFLRAIASDAEWRGVEVLWGSEQPSETAMPYSALVEALSGGLSPLRARQLAQLVEEIWLQALTPLLPPLASAWPDLPPAPPLEPAEERDRLAGALAHLLAGWAQIAPLLLVLEDLHWAGPATLDLLARLAPALSAAGVLVLGSYRSDEARTRPETWQGLQALDRAGVQGRLALDRLSDAAARELIRRSLGELTPHLDAQLFAETAGNPLFLLETLRALSDRGLLDQDEGGRWRTSGEGREEAELPLPVAVEEIISRRLGTLTPSARETLRLAAVLGERFDFDLLQAASPAEPAALLASLRTLVQRRFLDEAEQGYQFHHDKIRQVAYGGISSEARPRLHRWAGQALELIHPDQVAALAHHWLAAGEWDKAAAHHQQAGDQARAVYANAEAAAHYRQALEALQQLPTPAEPARLWDIRWASEQIHARLGARDRQREDLSALAGLAERLDDDQRRAHVALRRGKRAEEMADYDAVIVAAQTLLRLAQETGEGHIEAGGQRQWGVALWRQGKYQDALDRLQRALALARSEALAQEEAASLYALAAVARHTAGAAGAQDYGQQALALYRELDDRQGEAASLNLLGVLAYLGGDLRGASNHYEQALHARRLIGDLPGQAVSVTNLGVIHLTGGDYARALDCYEQSLGISRLTGNQLHQADALGNRGLVFLQIGAYAQAQNSLEESLALYREIGSRRGECSRLADLALLFHHRGDAHAAQDRAQEALAIAQELGNRLREAEAWYVLGEAQSDSGDLTAAAASYEQAVAIFRDMGQSNYVQDPLAGLARVALAQGDGAQALKRVEHILSHGDAGTVALSHEPPVVYLTCYRVLKAARDPRALRVLASAHALLQRRAARLPDERMRHAYLHGVAAHREIVSAYRTSQAHQQTEVRLPRAGAPTGRRLREEEYVPVTWTVAAPEDESLPAGPDRRQARLRRLLGEAADQGAAPRVGDLAAALGVSEPTVRRDLGTLRRAGHPAQTRGSRRAVTVRP
jgi:DNA-binding SARP family transcriptional activator/tetratricopeptide (TPR) repeat protein